MTTGLLPEVDRRHFELTQTFHNEEVRLRGPEWIEWWLTQELISHIRRNGVQMDRDTRLPGFTLTPAPHLPDHQVARISCDIAVMPRLVWPRG